MNKLYYVNRDAEIKELDVLENTSYGVVFTNENGMQRQISYGSLNTTNYFDSLKKAQKVVLKSLIAEMNNSRHQLLQSENKLAEFLYSMRVVETPFEDILDLVQHDAEINSLMEDIFNEPN